MFNNLNSLRLKESWEYAVSKFSLNEEVDQLLLAQARDLFYEVGEYVLQNTSKERLEMDRVWIKQSRVRALRIIETVHMNARSLTIPDDFMDNL